MSSSPVHPPSPSGLGLVSEEALLETYAETRDPRVREELVQRFTPFARSLALRYRRGSEPADDLLQVAYLGLVKALDRFDPERGRPFVAFGAPTILGELRRYIRDHMWTVRIPRGLGELSMGIDDTVDSLTEELGRAPRVDEIAARLDAPVESVLEALEADHARRSLSLDTTARPDDSIAPLVETLADTELGYDRIEGMLACESAELSDEERLILKLRFVDEMRQRDIGVELGMSQMQVSRISRQALWKLLSAVRGESEVEPVPVKPRQGTTEAEAVA